MRESRGEYDHSFASGDSCSTQRPGGLLDVRPQDLKREFEPLLPLLIIVTPEPRMGTMWLKNCLIYMAEQPYCENGPLARSAQIPRAKEAGVSGVQIAL
jgi:hypothetical protein